MFTRRTAARPRPDGPVPEPQAAADDRSFREHLESELLGDDHGPDGPDDPDVVPLGRVATAVRRSILIGVLPVFSAAYLWQATIIEVPDRALAVSPRSFPTIVGALMLLVSILVALVEVRRLLVNRSARAEGREVPPEIDDDKERITAWRDVWVTLAALVVYVAVFTVLGFFVSTVLFLVGLSTWFAPRRLVRNLVVSVVFSYGVYALFVNLLNVSLPNGILSGVM